MVITVGRVLERRLEEGLDRRRVLVERCGLRLRARE